MERGTFATVAAVAIGRPVGISVAEWVANHVHLPEVTADEPFAAASAALSDTRVRAELTRHVLDTAGLPVFAGRVPIAPGHHHTLDDGPHHCVLGQVPWPTEPVFAQGTMLATTMGGTPVWLGSAPPEDLPLIWIEPCGTIPTARSNGRQRVDPVVVGEHVRLRPKHARPNWRGPTSTGVEIEPLTVPRTTGRWFAVRAAEQAMRERACREAVVQRLRHALAGEDPALKQQLAANRAMRAWIRDGARLDDDRIAMDAQHDGQFVLYTNVPDLSGPQAATGYLRFLDAADEITRLHASTAPDALPACWLAAHLRSAVAERFGKPWPAVAKTLSTVFHVTFDDRSAQYTRFTPDQHQMLQAVRYR